MGFDFEEWFVLFNIIDVEVCSIEMVLDDMGEMVWFGFFKFK